MSHDIAQLSDELVSQLELLAHERGGGYALLETLDFLGWSTAVVSNLAGGVLLIAQQRHYPNLEVRASGDTVAEAAPHLFKEALIRAGYQSFRAVEH